MYQSKSQKYSHKALKISKFDIALQTEYEKKNEKSIKQFAQNAGTVQHSWDKVYSKCFQ